MNGKENIIGKKVHVNGFDVYCETRGHGFHIVLFIPGAMGTCATDFLDQYKGFDLETFTIVTLDLPGYGNSRPPKRDTQGN